MMKILQSVIITLLLAVPASASLANVYVAQTSAGGNTGVDCADAFAVTFFNTAGNWGAGAAQIGNDTIAHLCGTITTALTAQGSGASGHPITIKFESGAVMTSSAWASSGAINADSQSFIIIDGGTNGIIQNTGNSSTGTHVNSVAVHMQPCASCEVKNLTCSNLYVHSSFTDTSVDQTNVNCVVVQGSNWTIDNNTMHDCGWCIKLNYTTDTGDVINNNNIYNMDHGVSCAGALFTLTLLTIHDNHMHDMSNWDTMSDAYHHDGIHCFNGSGGKIQTIQIYNNLFDGNEGNCCVTSWIFLEDNGSSTPWSDNTGTAIIYNNVIIGSLDIPNGQLNIGRGTGHILYNDTILVTGTKNNGDCLRMRNSGGSGLTVTSKNSVYQGCGQVFSIDSATSTITWDFNAYGNVSGGNELFNWTGHTNGSANTVAAWKTQCSCDANAVGTLATTINLASNGRQNSGASIVGVGTNLTGAETAINSDILGNARPAPATAWDMGAYMGAGTSSYVTLPTTIQP